MSRQRANRISSISGNRICKNRKHKQIPTTFNADLEGVTKYVHLLCLMGFFANDEKNLLKCVQIFCMEKQANIKA